MRSVLWLGTWSKSGAAPKIAETRPRPGHSPSLRPQPPKIQHPASGIGRFQGKKKAGTSPPLSTCPRSFKHLSMNQSPLFASQGRREADVNARSRHHIFPIFPPPSASPPFGNRPFLEPIFTGTPPNPSLEGVRKDKGIRIAHCRRNRLNFVVRFE